MHYGHGHHTTAIIPIACIIEMGSRTTAVVLTACTSDLLLHTTDRVSNVYTLNCQPTIAVASITCYRPSVHRLHFGLGQHRTTVVRIFCTLDLICVRQWNYPPTAFDLMSGGGGSLICM